MRIETSVVNSYTREMMTSTGAMTDQSPDLIFGLDSMERVERVERVVISPIEGSTQPIDSPADAMTLTTSP